MNNKKSNQLPKGNYVIGDPCYFLKNQTYIDLVFDNGKIRSDGFNEINGRKVFKHSTKFGDGIYFDNSGNYYLVDSGQIGCFPLDNNVIDIGLYEERGFVNFDKGREVVLFNTVYFENDFYCNYKNGTFYFGHIKIKTD